MAAQVLCAVATVTVGSELVAVVRAELAQRPFVRRRRVLYGVALVGALRIALLVGSAGGLELGLVAGAYGCVVGLGIARWATTDPPAA